MHPDKHETLSRSSVLNGRHAPTFLTRGNIGIWDPESFHKAHRENASPYPTRSSQLSPMDHFVPEAFLENRVDLFCRRHMVLQDKCSLIHEQVGNSIGNKAGQILDDDRLLVQQRKQLQREPRPPRPSVRFPGVL
jgi:hypothetical protein